MNRAGEDVFVASSRAGCGRCSRSATEKRRRSIRRSASTIAARRAPTRRSMSVGTPIVSTDRGSGSHLIAATSPPTLRSGSPRRRGPQHASQRSTIQTTRIGGAVLATLGTGGPPEPSVVSASKMRFSTASTLCGVAQYDCMTQTIETPSAPLVVFCSGCGSIRTTHRSEFGHLLPNRCEWCGEVGWHEVDATAPHLGHQPRSEAFPTPVGHALCSGGKWGGSEPAFGTIRQEPGMPRGTGVCGACGERLRLDYHGLLPSHDHLSISI
jgi:hypothetical protein